MDFVTCCVPCSCDIVTCPLASSCCPTLLMSNASLYIDDIDVHTMSTPPILGICELPQVLSSEVLTNSTANMNSPFAYVITGSCPDVWLNDDIRERCEQGVYLDRNATKINPPVSSQITSYHFKNQACAMCNGEKESHVDEWNIELKCNYVIFDVSLVNLKHQVLEEHNCNIVFAPKISAYPCPWYKTINKCNVTGQWKEYNASIERACHAYTSIYMEFRNVFCFMCNGGNTFLNVPY